MQITFSSYFLSLKYFFSTIFELLFHLAFSMPSCLRKTTYIRTLYKVFLKRDADSGGLKNYERKFKPGFDLKNRIKILLEFASSSEFGINVANYINNKGKLISHTNSKKNRFPVLPALQNSFLHSHHEARCQMVQNYLPNAKHILDLGGGSAHNKFGALLSMGYDKIPESITIIDFPPDLRQASSFSKIVEKEEVTESGTKVKFVYGNFADLSSFHGQKFDLIFSGQTIEHVTVEEGQSIFKQVNSLLTENGSFCLDTPNRKFTEMLNPHGFIHPEHKVEYKVEQLIKIAEENNYEVIRKCGISQLEKSLCENVFYIDELIFF